MIGRPETVAVFRQYEARLDAELERGMPLFSRYGVGVKLLCFREHLSVFTGVGQLEWGLKAERKWPSAEGELYVNAHFFFQEPWLPTDPLFLHCNTQTGSIINGVAVVSAGFKHGGNIALVFEAGLANYVIERMKEICDSIGKKL